MCGCKGIIRPLITGSYCTCITLLPVIFDQNVKNTFIYLLQLRLLQRERKQMKNTNTKQYISIDSQNNPCFWIEENSGTFECSKNKKPVEIIDFRTNTLGCNVNEIYICLYVDIGWVFPKGKWFPCSLYSRTPETGFWYIKFSGIN